MTTPEAGVSYPRDVPVEAGMPEGWKGVEKQYGATSKYAGKVYTRYYSLDGKHKHVCSPKQVFDTHYKALGEDPAPRLAEYLRLQKERADKEADMRRIQREQRGQMAGEAREAAIQRFRDVFGALNGPTVFQFEGWVTRWHYQPNCDQVMVEYLDPEGNSWKLLKDLECAFQAKMDNGAGGHIPDMVHRAQALADPKGFAEGSKRAREAQGTVELSPATLEGGGTMISPEERARIAKERQDVKRAQDPSVKRPRLQVVLPPEMPSKAKPLPFESKAEIQAAFDKYRGILKQRGFPDDVALISVTGVTEERKYAKRISGVYYEMPEPFADYPVYQKLLHFPDAQDGVGCDPLFILVNARLARWEICTMLADVRPVIAVSEDNTGKEVASISEAGQWQVQDGVGEYFDDGLSITVSKSSKK